MKRKLFYLLLITGVLCFSCSESHRNMQKEKVVSFDLDSIGARGRLIAVTEFSSTNYYVYKGEPMGFTYELLKAFSDHLGIDLDIVTENHTENAIGMLETGRADLLATGIFADLLKNQNIIFTVPVEETSRVLVQRKPRNWQKMNTLSVEKSMLRDLTAPGIKTLYIQEGSSQPEYLYSVKNKTGKPFTFIGVPYDSEELIQLVEDGEIDYAVCNEDVAHVNSTYYPDIDVSTKVSPSKGLSWGVRKKDSAKLLEELDRWITTFRKTDTYASLYVKYYRNPGSGKIFRSDLYSLNSGRVSPWDDIIKIYSGGIKWDWRLLASLICQESRFIPNLTSRRGAYGLMQIMPETGKHFGIDITSSPLNNIKAGTEYIKLLHSIFDPKVPDENERIYFILAAYNAGPGHVLDAMRLAEKNGNDPGKWLDNVAVWMLKKSESQYYNDTVVKNGYFRGKESIAFVNEVLDRYRHYKNIIQ